MKSSRTKSQLERVEVGEHARVLCARTKIGWTLHLKRYNSTTYPFFIPILSGGHTDAPYISAIGKHYHCDYRFWSDELLDALYFEGDWCVNEDVWGLFAIAESEIVSMCILRRRCYREAPILAAKTRFLKNLEEEYTAQCLINSKCPHQGFFVLPCKKNSSIGICPGHGLTFDLKTDRMIERAK